MMFIANNPAVPFSFVLDSCRNSKLTHLLQDSLGSLPSLFYFTLTHCLCCLRVALLKMGFLSLGGDSKTLMFVQISPNENDLNESLCSLNFASRVRGIELGPAKRQLDMSEFLKCKQMVQVPMSCLVLVFLPLFPCLSFLRKTVFFHRLFF